MSKKKVAFVYVHNSCRNQITEAFGRHLAFDVFESYSAELVDKKRASDIIYLSFF